MVGISTLTLDKQCVEEYKVKRWWKVAVFTPLVLVALVLTGFSVWALTPPNPMAEADEALRSDAAVLVQMGAFLTFQPTGTRPEVGFIFYPGGRVDPRSYAPLARAIAEQGYLVVIPRMPLNMAVFAPARASAIIKQHVDVKSWVVGGHSLGGAMAANYARANSSAVRGLVLIGAYPAQSDDLSDLSLSVGVIYGTQDGLSSPAKVERARPQLPMNSDWVLLDGANHAQFGWYGEQSGDLPATISRDQQKQGTVEAVLKVLQNQAK